MKMGGERPKGQRYGYVRIPRPLIENKNLLAHEFRVLVFLKSFCISKPTCWPSITLIAGCLGIDKRQIRRTLKSLNHKGFLETKRVGRYNEYRPLK